MLNERLQSIDDTDFVIVPAENSLLFEICNLLMERVAALYLRAIPEFIMKNIRLFAVILLLVPFLSVTGCGGGGSDSDDKNVVEPVRKNMEISGVAKDYYTGEVIEGIRVKLVSMLDGQVVESVEISTDSEGRFLLSYPKILERVTIRGYGVDYGEYSVVINNEDKDDDIDAGEILFLKSHVSSDIDYSSGGDVVYEGISLVSLPASGVVKVGGGVPDGKINVNVTVIDPSVDPELMPGSYQAINTEDGEIEHIESYGAISVVMRDDYGDLLQLDGVHNATIRIPVAKEAVIGQAPATIPLYYFDDVSGYWMEEGEATLEMLESGEYVYVGEVGHFTVWNADIAYESVNINGCVEDGDGNPVSGARINSSGLDYIGSSYAISDENGLFSIPAKGMSKIMLNAVSNAGAISGTQVIYSGVADLDITSEGCIILNPAAVSIELSWGENPVDLDANLWGPKVDGEEEFHLNFESQSVLVDNVIMSLDIDDVDSFGPEIITIPGFPLPGKYRYCVHHYGGGQTIIDSPARVTLNLGDEQIIFSPDSAVGDFLGEDDMWCVFSFNVGGDLKPSIDVEQTVSTYYADYEETERALYLKATKKKKYYK